MMTNRYYILDYPVKAGDLMQFIECKSLEPRINNDETKCIVRLQRGETPKLELVKQTSYTHKQIRVILQDAEWQPQHK